MADKQQDKGAQKEWSPAIVQSTVIPLAKIEVNKGQIDGLPTNPRSINKDKFKKLKQSITDNPEMTSLRELLVYRHGDKYVIIGGNMRFRAMKELKYKEAVCKVIPPDASIDQLKAYTIKDNAAFGDWDFEELANSWDTDILQDWGVDIPSFEPGDIEEEAKDDNFDVEANTPRVAKAKLGDVYQLGKHRLICGDSTDERYISVLMQGEMADMICTDPPYNVNYEGGKGMKIQNDNMEDSQFLSFLHDAFTAANEVMRQGAAFYIWHADSEGYNFRTAVKQVGWKVRQCLIWNKNAMVLGRQDYQWKHEPCLYGWKEGAAHYFVNRRDLYTVFEDKPDLDSMTKTEMKEMLEKFLSGDIPTTVIDEKKPARNEDHPTMKPVPLMGKIIRNSSRPGEIVLDIFGGSGSTLIACEQLGRGARLCELDPIYIDVIIKRWEQLTGEKAVKLGNIDEEEIK